MNTQRCPTHEVPLITVEMTFCPACRGSVTSQRKASMSRQNGKRGGRPIGRKDSRPRVRRKKVVN